MPNALNGLLADPRGEMRATPRNKLMGLLADALGSANSFATQMDPRYENKRQNQTLGLLADAVSLGSLAKTADRMSYGEPLTNKGKANVPLLKPETADALMMAPLSPRNALAALGMGMADNGAMRAATVWHASPHKFDKFDASKIGAGQGEQVYGHGLYFADSPEVGGVGGQYFKQFQNHPQAKKQGGPFAYSVDLPDEAIGKMVDWDKPLGSQTKEVQQAIASIIDAEELYKGKHAARLMDKRTTAGEVLDILNKELGGANVSAGYLRDAGIPGVRYTEDGTQGAGRGTSSYAVFPGNESFLKILQRSGGNP